MVRYRMIPMNLDDKEEYILNSNIEDSEHMINFMSRMNELYEVAVDSIITNKKCYNRISSNIIDIMRKEIDLLEENISHDKRKQRRIS